ncbi:hypothetical protein, partial [Xanthomonas oryzae]|uniref:hypothetical protein n=1 Tax=Xanthomonas oryzae TaxID=347 RepID=UPI001C52E947
WQFQHTDNADEALQWMWSGGFSGATTQDGGTSRREQGSGQAKQLEGLLTTRGDACVMAALAIG